MRAWQSAIGEARLNVNYRCGGVYDFLRPLENNFSDLSSHHLCASPHGFGSAAGNL
jgi:hypothetical protein